ncbi:hypothetical protein [uncultured Parabacteroides sp.]|uniref:hypothetical protein n=1 Tax=uncultured Parabacteroides sp. TaxID=512312 RepID=UPI002620470F|nr:hypothetical protein [uncultured Parabacteroides sp.]
MEMIAVKNITVSRSKQCNACNEGYMSILQARTKQDILNVAKSNFSWVVENGIILPDEWIQFFTCQELENNRIYYDGKHHVTGGNIGYFTGSAIAILSGGSKGVMTGNSIAHVYDTSYAHLFGNSIGVIYGEKALCVVRDKKTAKSIDYFEAKRYCPEVL